MPKKGLLALIVLAQILNAYDFNASNFTGTQISDFYQGTHENQTYYRYNDNAATAPNQAGQSANGGLNIGIIFDGNNAYLYNGNLYSNPFDSKDKLESTNMFIYGAGNPNGSASRYMYLDFTNSNLSYTDLQKINLRGGSTNESVAKEYLVLNMRYRGADGLIKNGLYFNPSTAEGKMLLTMIGFEESPYYSTAGLPSYQPGTDPNTPARYKYVSPSSKLILRGTSVFDNIAQELYSHDILFGSAPDSEIYPNAVRTAVFYGNLIDFSGNYWLPDGTISTTPRSPNSREQTITLNGANAIDKQNIEFRIGSGTTNIGLYNLGSKFVNFSNLSDASKLKLTSIGSSVVGNINYANADSSLNMIFNNSAMSVNTPDSENVALNSLIASGSRYLGANGAGTNSATITIGDNAQISFIGAGSHRFNGTLDNFAFNGAQGNSANSVMFLNAGDISGQTFNVANSSINFSVFGTNIQNLNLSDSNTLKAVFDNSANYLWSAQGYNVGDYFQSATLGDSRLSGTATLGDNAKAIMVFNGGGTFNATLSGGTLDSQIFLNGANITSQLNGYKGEVTAINSNFISALNTTAASASKYTHIFNGVGTTLEADLSAGGKAELSKILNNINAQSGNLAQWSVADLTTESTLQNVTLDSSKKMDLVFIGANSVSNSNLYVNTNINQGLYHYTFIDFGAIDLSTQAGLSANYGNAVVTMAGNTYSTGNIGVAYTGTLDVSSANRNNTQSFFGKNIYGETTKDITFNYGGDAPVRGNRQYHQGYIVEGDKSSRYIFSNLDTLDFTRPVSVSSVTINNIGSGDIKTSVSINANDLSNLQKHLIANGINFYVDGNKYGINGSHSSAGNGATIGFKGTNIIGDLTDDKFNIDAVFNSTNSLDEAAFIDSNGVSKYGVVGTTNTRASSLDGQIYGDTAKRITFIGSQSFNADKLAIMGGTSDSVYSFYSVGEINQNLMGKILNAQAGNTNTNGVVPVVSPDGDGAQGSFVFAGSTIINANIIKNATPNANTSESIKIGENLAQGASISEFSQGVLVNGRFSGSMKKEAILAQGSSIIVREDSADSVYDFSLSGVDLANGARGINQLIVANVDFSGYTQAAQILGLNGTTSIAGVFKNSTIGTSQANANQLKFSNGVNGARGGHWFVPESSVVDSIILQNDYNLLATSNAMSQSTFDSQLAIVDLATYDWDAYKYDEKGVAQLFVPSNAQGAQNGVVNEPDFYTLKARDLGAGFSKKTFSVMPTTFADSQSATQYRSLFDSTNGVFRLGLNLSKPANEASDEILILSTQSLNSSNNFLQLIQAQGQMREYEYDVINDKIYLATAAVYDGNATLDSVISDNLFSADNSLSEISNTQGIFRIQTQINSEEATLSDTSEFASTIKETQPNINITDYKVKRWYLQSLKVSGVDVAVLDSATDSLKASFGMGYAQIFAETNNLAKRMGELRAGNDKDGAWVRMTKGGISGENGLYSHALGIQGGFDKKSEFGGNRVYAGFVGGITQNWGAHNGMDSKSNVLSIGAYRSAINADGSYLDIVGKYLLMLNTHTINTNEFNGSASPTSHAGYVSAEYGRRFGVKGYRGLFLQPSAEMILGVIGEQNMRLNTQFVNYGANLSYRQTFLAIVKAGADLMGHFRNGSKAGYWRVGASLVRDIGNRGRVEMSTDFDGTTSTRILSGDTQVLISAGMDYRASRDLRIYVEADRGFFGTYNVDYLISAGVRYNFGAKNARKPHIQQEFEQMQYMQGWY